MRLDNEFVLNSIFLYHSFFDLFRGRNFKFDFHKNL